MSGGKITIGNVCFLIDREKSEVLLLERSFEPMSRQFTGVGGKTYFDEDIYRSCIREVKEETGLDVAELQLKGVVKTLLDEQESSWILFVYVADRFSGKLIDCPEGTLRWVKLYEMYSLPLIGFIREILPYVFQDNIMVEGTILHDSKGKVLGKELRTVRS